MWLANGQGSQLKLCTYLDSYNAATNQCEPCETPNSDAFNVFGTFMVQQAVCQSCNSLVMLYGNDPVAIQNAYRLCEEPYSQKTTAEYTKVVKIVAVSTEAQPESSRGGFLRVIDWFVDNIAHPYVERTNQYPMAVRVLIHISLVVAICLLPLSCVLACYIQSRRNKEKTTKPEKSDFDSFAPDVPHDYERARFDSQQDAP